MKPVLQALVLAERVYETKTGQMVIAGTFRGVRFSKRPLVKEMDTPEGGRCQLIAGGQDGGSPHAYVSLTDICDGTEVVFQFVNLTKNEILLSMTAAIHGVDRLGIVELNLPLPKLPIAEEGIYAFEVVCEGEILGSHRVVAEQIHHEEGE